MVSIGAAITAVKIVALKAFLPILNAEPSITFALEGFFPDSKSFF